MRRKYIKMDLKNNRKSGFPRSFWTANLTELFERGALSVDIIPPEDIKEIEKYYNKDLGDEPSNIATAYLKSLPVQHFPSNHRFPHSSQY